MKNCDQIETIIGRQKIRAHKRPPEHSAVFLLHYTLHIRHGSLFSLSALSEQWFPFRIRGVSAGHSDPAFSLFTAMFRPFIPNSQTAAGKKSVTALEDIISPPASETILAWAEEARRIRS